MNAFPPIGRIESYEPGGERIQAIQDMTHRYESFAHMHLKMEKMGDHHVNSYLAERAKTAVTARPGSMF
jgi:hypothetical protein